MPRSLFLVAALAAAPAFAHPVSAPPAPGVAAPYDIVETRIETRGDEAGLLAEGEAWLAAMLAEGMGVKSAAAVVTARLGGRKKQWYQCAQALKDRDA